MGPLLGFPEPAKLGYFAMLKTKQKDQESIFIDRQVIVHLKQESGDTSRSMSCSEALKGQSYLDGVTHASHVFFSLR